MILTYGPDPSRSFYTAPMNISNKAASAFGTSGGRPYSDGQFILMRSKNNPNKFTHVLINDSYENELGLKLAKQYQQVLQKEFPNIQSILYSEVPQRIK